MWFCDPVQSEFSNEVVQMFSLTDVETARALGEKLWITAEHAFEISSDHGFNLLQWLDNEATKKNVGYIGDQAVIDAVSLFSALGY